MNQDKKQFVINRVNSFYPHVKVKFFHGQGANSFVAGKAIYFNYEIINRLQVPQLQALVDHEVAHYKYGHVYVNRFMFMIWVLGTGLPWLYVSTIHFFYLAQISALSFMVCAWIYRGIIRRQEYIADRYSVTYNGPREVIKMLVEVSNTDLFKSSFSHPSIKDRINKINGHQV